VLAHRLCRERHAASPLDGEGARLFGGRWNPKNVPMVYAASSIALAAFESFVHFSSSLLPLDYVHVALEIPDDVAMETWTSADLPAGWDDPIAPAALQELGREWTLAGRTAVLRLPSAVVSAEVNILINPRHVDATRIVARPPEPFRFDTRLIKVPVARAKNTRKATQRRRAR
jgi:RES domain-containing protein